MKKNKIKHLSLKFLKLKISNKLSQNNNNKKLNKTRKNNRKTRQMKQKINKVLILDKVIKISQAKQE